MNVKTKLFGSLVATGLALSITTGVLAQSGTAILLEDSSCTASLSGSDVDFGTYVWDGTDSYDLVGSAGNTTLTATVTDDTQAQAGCTVTFSAGNMSDGTSTINVDYVDGTNPADNPLTVSGTGQVTVTAVIASTLSSAFDSGSYTGTVSVDSSAAS